MGKIRAISLWEPWASLVAVKAKKWETRSWGTELRSDLLICAAKKKDSDAMKLVTHDFQFQNGLQALVRNPKKAGWTGITPEHLNFGMAVAIVKIAICITTEQALEKHLISFEEATFGDYSAGRFAWKFENVRRIKEPFPVKGKQGFFFVEMPEGVEYI